MEKEWKYSVDAGGSIFGTGSNNEWQTRYQWCFDTFPKENFRSGLASFQFRYKKDAEFFAIRWTQ